MGHGIRRKPYQVLPGRGIKVTCVQINDHGFNTEEWFEESFQNWYRNSNPVATSYKEWDFVLVIPLISVRSYWAGNDGMQAWRNRKTGQLIPDHCRQTGGCPEVWNSSDVRGKKELEISNLQEVEEYVVVEHSKDVSKSVFLEQSLPGVSLISFP
jgi:hypothetical protein